MGETETSSELLQFVVLTGTEIHWLRGFDERTILWDERVERLMHPPESVRIYRHGGKPGPKTGETLPPLREGLFAWVREAFAPRPDLSNADDDSCWRHYTLYRADGEERLRDPMNWHDYGDRWKAARTMPERLCRYRVEVLRVEPMWTRDVQVAVPDLPKDPQLVRKMLYSIDLHLAAHREGQ